VRERGRRARAAASLAESSASCARRPRRWYVSPPPAPLWRPGKRRLKKGRVGRCAREVASLGTSGNAHYRTWPCPVTALARRQLKRREEGAAREGQAPRRARPPLARLDIMHLHYVVFPRHADAPGKENAARGAALSSRPLPQGGSPTARTATTETPRGSPPAGPVSVLELRPSGGAFASCARSPAGRLWTPWPKTATIWIRVCEEVQHG